MGLCSTFRPHLLPADTLPTIAGLAERPATKVGLLQKN